MAGAVVTVPRFCHYFGRCCGNRGKGLFLFYRGRCCCWFVTVSFGAVFPIAGAVVSMSSGVVVTKESALAYNVRNAITNIK